MDKRTIKEKPTAHWVAWFIGRGKQLVDFHNSGRVGSGTGKDLITRNKIVEANKHYSVVASYINQMLYTRNVPELMELFKKFLREM